MALLIELFETQLDVGLLILRLALAAVFLKHGTDKLKMWNMEPSEEMSEGMLNFMKYLGVAETLAAISQILGFLTQISAIGLSIVMIGAIFTKIRTYNLSFLEEQATGWEFDTMNLAAALLLVFAGAGSISIDALLFPN